MYDEIRGTTNLEEVEEQIEDGITVVAKLTTDSAPDQISKWFSYLGMGVLTVWVHYMVLL